MSRNYGTPLDFVEAEHTDRALDCLGSRQAAGPFHYLINEQAKSLLALQELQNEVGALLEFRDLVIETFPSLKTRLSSPNTSNSNGNNQILVRTDWVPGVRVRRKLGPKKNDGISDSGFSTETSSKDTHSASSTAMATTSAGAHEETDDELWSLLDIIHHRGVQIRDELEALQGQLQQSSSQKEFHSALFEDSIDHVREIKEERDALTRRLTHMEAEVVANRIHTSRLQEDVEQLLTTKQDLEEQLHAVLNQRGEVNLRIHDLHTQFVTRTLEKFPSNNEKVKISPNDNNRTSEIAINKKSASSQIRTNSAGGSDETNELNKVLGDKLPQVKLADSKKISAILLEQNPLVLQKHLLVSTIQNELLCRQLEKASRIEVNLVDKLDKTRDENEELRFQLEDKNIELEGTRARVRVLEHSQKPPNLEKSDTISSSKLNLSRDEIISASMKNMSPIPMNLQVDHSSSTESAHDQTEFRKNLETARRRPSKIPLKSYTAPKPPGKGKSSSSSAQGHRSCSSDSPGRSHSAQSSRGGGRSETSSLQGASSKNGSLTKSRNGSLVTSKDSLSSKLRSSDSLSKLSPSTYNSFGNRENMRKNSSPIVKWTNNSYGKEQQSADKESLSQPNPEKFQYQWNPCSFDSKEVAYPDSLDHNSSSRRSYFEKFQTANTFSWNNKIREYYDSIDSNLFSSLYQQNEERLAECDSLEKNFFIISNE